MYYMDIKLQDSETDQTDFRLKHVPAGLGLIKTAKFLKNKDSDNSLEKLWIYIKKDFNEFERLLQKDFEFLRK